MRKIDAKKAYRLLYPEVPAIVASSHSGVISAMPVASVISLSNDPPRIGFSSSPSHSTYRTVLASRSFTLSWLDKKFVRPVELLGAPAGAGESNKLASVGLKHHRGEKVDAPVIDLASAVLECSLFETFRLGDHELIVGDVKAAYASEDFLEYWQFKAYDPILYIGSPDVFRTYNSR